MSIIDDKIKKILNQIRESNQLHSKKNPSAGDNDSSKESLSHFAKSGKLETEKIRAIKASMKLGPASRQMLANELNLPINHITRCVYDLAKDGLFKELEERKKCKITGRNVYYVQLIPELLEMGKAA